MLLENTDIAQPIQSEHAVVLPGTEELVSVVVPCCGQLECTRLCVPSLLRHSRAPFELIFVDIESLDGTPEYLAGIAAAASVPIEVLLTNADDGFAAACNKGLIRARGDFIVLLSNDTIVPDGWLNHLVALARMDSSVGIVGAMSNHAEPPQSVGSIPYRLAPAKAPEPITNGQPYQAVLDVTPVYEFAKTWSEQNRGQWFEAERLASFCLLIRREVLPKVGFLDTRSPLPFHDDEGFCRKVRQAGYRLACCRDLFIHHFGSRTATGHGRSTGSTDSPH